MPEINKSQAKSIARVGVIHLLVTVFGFAQAILIGRIFGVSRPIEIYFAAVILYRSIFGLLQTGQIVEIATPKYHQIKAKNGERAANAFFSALLNLTLLASIFPSLLIILVSPLLANYLLPGFTSEDRLTCINMLQWIAPCISLQVVSSLLSNWLAAHKLFEKPELAKLLIQIFNLLCLLLLADIMGAWALVCCLWITNILSVISMGLLLRWNEIKYYAVISDNSGNLKSVIWKLPEVLSYVFSTQLYSIALNAGLTLLPEGTLAIVNYGIRVSSKISSLLMRPISVVFFNNFSAAYSQGSASVGSLVRNALDIGLFTSATAVVIITAIGFPSLCTIWLSNEFSSDMIFRTYVIACTLTTVASTSIPGIIYRKINMAHQHVWQQYMALTVVQICSSIYAYFFMPSFGSIGVVLIIAMNPIGASIASGLVLLIYDRENCKFYELRSTLSYFFCASVAILPSVAYQQIVFKPSLNSQLDNLATGVFCGAFSLCSFICLANLFSLHQARQLTAYATKRVRNSFNNV